MRGALLIFSMLSATLAGCSAVQGTYVRAGWSAKAPDAAKRIAVMGWSDDAHPKLDALLAEVAADRIKLRMNYLVYTYGSLQRGWSDACGSVPMVARHSTFMTAAALETPSHPAPPKDEEAAAPEAPAAKDTSKQEDSGGSEPTSEGAAIPEPSPDSTAVETADTAPTTESPAAEEGPSVEAVLTIRALEVGSKQGVIEMRLESSLFRCGDGALLWRAVGSEGNAAADEDLAGLTESYITNIGDEIAPYAGSAFLVLRDMLETLPDVELNDDEIMEKIELD